MISVINLVCINIKLATHSEYSLYTRAGKHVESRSRGLHGFRHFVYILPKSTRMKKTLICSALLLSSINSLEASAPLPLSMEEPFSMALPADESFTVVQSPYTTALGKWKIAFNREPYVIRYALCCIRCPTPDITVNLKWSYTNKVENVQGSLEAEDNAFDYHYHREEQYSENDLDAGGVTLDVTKDMWEGGAHPLRCEGTEGQYPGVEEIIRGTVYGYQADPHRPIIERTEDPVLKGVLSVKLIRDDQAAE